MGIFSKKNKGNIRLSKADFKTESEDYKLSSVKVSGDFFSKSPELGNKDNDENKSATITNSTEVKIAGKNVDVTFLSNDIELNEDKFIELMSQKLNWISEHERELKKSVAKKLLPLKNETWLEEDESQLSISEFMKRIELSSISFYGKGNSEMIFDDGDLFWGHDILAILDTNNRLNDITIRG